MFADAKITVTAWKRAVWKELYLGKGFTIRLLLTSDRVERAV
jgi:hypothetical protein